LSSSAATATAVEPIVVSRPPVRSLISREKQSAVLCLLLVLLTLAFYNSIVHNGFTNFDDNGYITQNDHVRAGLSWSTVKWAFSSTEAANWHPLTWLSHALDYQLFKMNPAGHHYVTVLMHAANAVLLFLLLARATGFTWPSFFVAALFALHPVNVESVAWAAERKNVLSMLFFLVALHAYGWYVRRESVKRYAVIAALFALGLMAKPEIITLPFVLLLWDYWPLRRMFGAVSGEDLPHAPVPRSFSFLALEKVPLLLLSAASAVITFMVQSAGDAVRTGPIWVRLANVPVAYVRYLGKVFWPTRLAVLYPHPGRFLPTWKALVSILILLLLTAIVVRFRSRRYLAVGWFWFLGTLVPVIGIVQVGVQAMADRYAYLAYIGLFVGVVWWLGEIAREWEISPVWLAAPAGLVLLTFGMITRHQLTYWHDDEVLWRHALSVTERNYTAHDALARDLARQGRMDEAIAEFDAAYNLHAYTALEILDIGAFEQTHGRAKDAIEEYQRALENSPDSKSRSVALTMLGSAFTQTGDFVRAKLSYAYALREDPENSDALVSRGLLAERDGDYPAAIERISHAMKIAPTDGGYLLLGQALRRAGHQVEADEADVHAQLISHDLAKAKETVAQVLASAGIKADLK
jgi:tetratricopeptide (TPR) repeat protein